MCDTVILDVGTALVTFEKRSIMTSTNRLMLKVFGSGPRLSIATNANGQLDGNSCMGRCWLPDGLFWAHW